MRYGSAEAFRTALEARLNQGSTTQQDLARRRRTMAFDRLLSRLAHSGDGRWILKGGAAIEFRHPDRARATRDVDLALAEGGDPLELLQADIATDPFGDHFSFTITRSRELEEDSDRGAVRRLSVDAILSGRTFERFVVDIAHTSSIPTTDTVELGRQLNFAGLPVVAMPVIDLRTHWAEKLSAYLRRYADRPNTRVKDLADLVLLIELGLKPDRELLDCIIATLGRREQELPPEALPSMASEWEQPFASMAKDLKLETTTASDAHKLVDSFWHQTRAHGLR